MSLKEYGSVVRGYYAGFDARTRQALWGAVAVIILAGALMGYKWYATRYYEQVQQALSEVIDLGEQARSRRDMQLWQEVERAAQAGYSTYGSSWLAPYFLAVQADAQAHVGDAQKALAILDDAVKAMKKGSPWYYLYATKRALMQCDAQDDSLKQEGHKNLDMLAEDTSNPQRDEALYYRGYYVFVDEGKQAARALWAPLLDTQADTFKNSPWAALARKKVA